MNPNITLTTPRLQLITLSQSQLETFIQAPSLLAVSLDMPLDDHIFNPAVYQAASIKVGKMRLAAAEQHHWYTYWLIVRRDKNLGIGTIGFKGQPDLNGEVEIGYGISPQHREYGFMTEAAQALTEWALGQPDCTAVLAVTSPDNIASHRVLQKIGMTRVDDQNGEWRWEIKAESRRQKSETWSFNK